MSKPLGLLFLPMLLLGLLAAMPAEEPLDILIADGHVVDGTGNPWYAADVGIRNGRIAAIGKLAGRTPAKRTIDAQGLIVAPGFIDMLGQSEVTLLVDGRAESKIRQGITSEITGEGNSIAPQNEKTLPEFQEGIDILRVKADWRKLDEYFARLERQGTAINLGTYVGATQVRQAVIGDDDRAPAAGELARMKQLVAEAMEQGAMGLSTSLVYSPAIYAKTEELIELSRVASNYGGTYATHMRNEGLEIFSALDETFRIGREAQIPIQIFHLKVSGKPMWGRMNEVIERINQARASGLDVTANMYPYVAGATGLVACLPPWAQDGGNEKTLARLRDPALRERMKDEMQKPAKGWQGFYYISGGPANILISSVMNQKLRPLQGNRLSQAAQMRGQDPLDALFDILIEDRLQTGAIYFLMDEADVRAAIPQPWICFGLDAPAVRPDGILGSFPSHPRAYGTFTRLLGRYVRNEHLTSLENMIRKMTSLAAQSVRIEDRGVLKPGMWADVTVIDFGKIADVATFEDPNRYSEGVRYVVVNGQLVLDDGKMTGALPGRVLRGHGYRSH
jgi:N-acyl-D-amino-acid deacylase